MYGDSGATENQAPKKISLVQYAKVAKVLLLFCLIAYALISIFRQRLPEETEILGVIRDTSPTQESVSVKPFDITSGKLRYSIQPLYTYDLYGVVVSQYDARNFLDVAHKFDKLNIKDVCVVWGDNIIHSIYAKLDYSHGEFTCFVNDGKGWRENYSVFRSDQFSNNHLIPANEEVSSIIGEVKVGDQIHIKGYLSKYSAFGSDNQLIGTRNTSVTRNDSGNGACEVVFVTSIDILKKWGRIADFFENFIIIIALICAGVLCAGPITRTFELNKQTARIAAEEKERSKKWESLRANSRKDISEDL